MGKFGSGTTEHFPTTEGFTSWAATPGSGFRACFQLLIPIGGVSYSITSVLFSNSGMGIEIFIYRI